MKKLLLFLAVITIFVIPAKALDLEAPIAPSSVERYMPDESASFAKDLWHIIKNVLQQATPEIADALSVCASVISVQLLIAMVQNISGIARKTILLIGVIALCILLIKPSSAMIRVGSETIDSITEYNKLLLPVMTAALAAQGGVSASAALYAGTVVLDTILSVLITKVILPLLYAYIALGIAFAALEEKIFGKLIGFIKWLLTWLLKIILYVFTGYMGITGVISGTVDASTIKATKLAISGTVPIVGNIISDASEAILVGAGVVKNSVGVFGLLVILTLWLVPFIKISIRYLMLKSTAGISSLYADKRTVLVVDHISSAMGFLLAMTSTVCLLQLISVVCFMKGMSA